MKAQIIAEGNVGTVHGEPASVLYRVLDVRNDGPTLTRALLLENINTAARKVVHPAWFWVLLDSFD